MINIKEKKTQQEVIFNQLPQEGSVELEQSQSLTEHHVASSGIKTYL